jgi:lysophospholipase L1-like esterase
VGVTFGLLAAIIGPSLARLPIEVLGQGTPGSQAHATRVDISRASWVATWAAAPQAATDEAPPQSGFDNRTVRDVIYTSVGGSAIRVQISNRYGTRPLHIGAATVGMVLDGAALIQATIRPLAFGPRDSATVVIPAGASVTSDPLDFYVRPLTELAISLYLPKPTGPTTNHFIASQDTYVAYGDHADTSRATSRGTIEHSWYFVTEVDVRSVTAHGTIVAFGDSITDGIGSGLGSDDRWPNYLARRIDAAYGDRAPGVVDEGIGGNRVLTGSQCSGAGALQRFARDALSVSGVRAIILLEGINDISYAMRRPDRCTLPANRGVTAAQLEAAYQRLISMAHARGVKVDLGTLTPAFGHLTSAGQTMRTAVNNWILGSYAAGISDGVINFAGVVCDPQAPSFLNPAYNSGDSLHPNDLGYNMMASAVPLAWVR